MGARIDGKKKVVETDIVWDAKGDLAVATDADAATRLPVGTSGQVLTLLSSETTGMKWATPTTGGVTVHSDLTGLSYTSSAHTGFAPIDSPIFIGTVDTSGAVVTAIGDNLKKLMMVYGSGGL